MKSSLICNDDGDAFNGKCIVSQFCLFYVRIFNDILHCNLILYALLVFTAHFGVGILCWVPNVRKFIRFAWHIFASALHMQTVVLMTYAWGTTLNWHYCWKRDRDRMDGRRYTKNVSLWDMNGYYAEGHHPNNAWCSCDGCWGLHPPFSLVMPERENEAQRGMLHNELPLHRYPIWALSAWVWVRQEQRLAISNAIKKLS